VVDNVSMMINDIIQKGISSNNMKIINEVH